MTPADETFLRRCIDLAAEAASRGDDPFGSMLVASDGSVLAERTNQVATTGDVTAHPELHLAQWASVHMTREQRSAATMYTSGEHCPMCAAAHVWAGIGRLVFALSAEQIRDVATPGTIILLSARDIIERSNASIVVEGPCDDLVAEAQALFR